jgi:hypothetical protein
MNFRPRWLYRDRRTDPRWSPGGCRQRPARRTPSTGGRNDQLGSGPDRGRASACPRRPPTRYWPVIAIPSHCRKEGGMIPASVHAENRSSQRGLIPIVLIVIGLLTTGTGNAAPQTADTLNTSNQPTPRRAPSDVRDPSDLLWLLSVSDRSTLSIPYQRQLEKLGESKLPTAEMAKNAALGYKSTYGGLLAEEGAAVIELVPLGVDIPGFAESGDLIWVVQCFHQFKGMTQELWISSTTGEVKAMLPAQREYGSHGKQRH